MNSLQLDFQPFTDRIVRPYWDLGMKSVELVMEKSGLFTVDSWEDGVGNTRTYNEMDVEEFASNRQEGDEGVAMRYQLGYEKIATLKQIAATASITKELRKDNKRPEVETQLLNLTKPLLNRMELDLVHRFTFGFQTTYTDKDGAVVDISMGSGQPLFSNVNPLKASAKTYSNILANNPIFSDQALAQMERLCITDTMNHFGEKMSMTFDTIFSTDNPDDCNNIAKVLQSTASLTYDPVGAGTMIRNDNPNIYNPYKSKYKHLKLPRLASYADGSIDNTKMRWWGVASTNNRSAYYSLRERPYLLNEMDPSTLTYNYFSYARYSICIVNNKWIKISRGDGNP